ncbi:MAG TPA: hypothetical protein VE973_03875 [Candidatus Limnocylindria bacterium]|nr:hypothetical protein [Candidatus Limnocylindria bacterium]
MKVFLKKNITMAAVAAIVIFIFIINSKKPEQNIVLGCQATQNNALVECVKNKILLEINNNPSLTGSTLNEVWTSNNSIDLRTFSPLAHMAGMMLVEAKIELKSAINYCGNSFKGACAHGAIMEYIDAHNPGNVQFSEFRGICNLLNLNPKQYKNCAHAVGHELRAKASGENAELVLLCDYFDSKYRPACASGILMEASTGNNGSGYHSHMPVGQFSFDCNAMPAGYKHTCYSSQGSYKQYEANSEPWKTTFEFCSSIPKIYETDCFAGVDERLLMSKSGNMAEAEKICDSLSTPEKNGCLLVKNMSLDTLE